jgi:hypothetical protein
VIEVLRKIVAEADAQQLEYRVERPGRDKST